MVGVVVLGWETTPSMAVMVNKYRKGYRIEKKAMLYLERLGWTCWRAKITRFSDNDFFGNWDIVGVAKNAPTIWVQVKSNRISKKELDKLKDFSNKYFAKNVNVGYAFVYAKRKFKVIPVDENEPVGFNDTEKQ